jgi:hypothetical protein
MNHLISSNKIIRLLKTTLLLGLLFFVSTIVEIYWAMGKFSEKMSSGCLDCTFIEDVFLMSLMTTVFLTILFLLFSFIKNRYLKFTIQILFLISIWFFWNYNVFVDRESSWSTYTFSEELYYTISISVFPVLVLSLAAIFASNYIFKNHEPK